MSNPPPPQNIVEWFQQNYPREFDMQEEVVRRAGDIFARIPVQPTPGRSAPVRIELVDRPEGGLTLAMNDLGIVYLGALATAILESLTAELEGLLSSGIGSAFIKERVQEVLRSEGVSSPHVSTTTKKCPKCQAENDIEAQFCDQCTTKLE
jgi:hypothetical protein